MKQLVRLWSGVHRHAWFARHRRRFRESEPRRPRVYVDVSVIARNDARTGIQRVVRALWLELSRRHHPTHDFVPVYAGARHGYRRACWKATAERPTLTAEVVKAAPGDHFIGLDLSAHYLPSCTRQLADWRAAGLMTHFVVYDLLPVLQPDWFNAGTVGHFTRWLDTIAAHGDSLLSISDAVGRQLADHFDPVARPPLGRLRLSGDLTHSRPTTGIPALVAEQLDAMARRPTLLMVGTVEPRKGYSVALHAMERLWAAPQSSAPDLMIIGKAGWKTGALQQQIRQHAEYGRRLHWLEGVSDEALEVAYARASALLLATRSEGYGLPLAEASRHRKWVLARDLPVFREQLLSNVRYFGDDHPEPLAAAIERIMAVAAQGDPPVQHLLSWAECADELLVEIGVDRPAVVDEPIEQDERRVAAR
ncbi:MULTISPECIES: glycosyltransferase family 4 protein [Sphingomonas]|uniref:glycosyltransferase family 4 protein n=1 Tax=Sphingomonas TaxID=13687 RepID=UPI000DEFF209|nr:MULTISPECIES: glycosyltransferase family 1 protein [Sphingomonas]